MLNFIDLIRTTLTLVPNYTFIHVPSNTIFLDHLLDWFFF